MDISQRAEKLSAKSSGGSSLIPTPPATQGEDTSNNSEDSFGYADDQIVKVPLDKLKEHFKKLPQESQVFAIDQSSTKEALALLAEFQTKARHPRRYLSNDWYLLVKEMPSQLHARIAMYVQDAIHTAFVECLPVQQNGLRERWRIEGCGDGCLEFPRFRGEPDAGVAFRGESCPFALVEVGVYDTREKTKRRAAHWITRGKPGVNFSLSVKIGRGANFQVVELEVEVLHNDMSPAVAMQTRGAIHGKTSSFDVVDFLTSARTSIRVPTAGLPALNLPAGFIMPTGPYMNIDLGDLLPKARAAIRF